MHYIDTKGRNGWQTRELLNCIPANTSSIVPIPQTVFATRRYMQYIFDLSRLRKRNLVQLFIVKPCQSWHSPLIQVFNNFALVHILTSLMRPMSYLETCQLPCLALPAIYFTLRILNILDTESHFIHTLVILNHSFIRFLCSINIYSFSVASFHSNYQNRN